MASVDEVLVDEKLAVLERAREWSPRSVAKLEALLHAADDVALVRVNPFSFARERGMAPAEALDLFLHATRVGLFTMDWHLLCPACGIAVESFASLRQLRHNFFCSLCAMQTDANLDDYIQVSFTVAPAVRRLAFHDVEALSAADYLYKLRFTREAHFASLAGPRMCDVMPENIKVLTWVQPGERREFAAELSPGAFAGAEFQAHTGAGGMVTSAARSTHVDFVVDETETTGSVAELPPGRITGSVENRRARPVVFALGTKPTELLEMEFHPICLEPIVTGAMLLTNQTFRRLFRSETVSGADGIGVRDVTVLFTDLKGSTALYERIGDLKAFALVQRHFERLAVVVAERGGAIVKTIGDAVMAAFQQPVDAVRAAIDMQAQIDGFNREHGSRDVVLKIGIHRGPSIAVTLNDSLDYFGHTINVAARVQGLADADEIYVTDDVYRADGVADLLRRVESRDAQLRGIQRQVRVHKARNPTA